MISVIICTYNRVELLREALASLMVQTVSNELFEIVVVDNNSIDDTQQVVREYMQMMPNCRVVTEKKQGLGFARNRGYVEARGEWCFYFDDDALAAPDMLEQAIYTIEYYDFDIFGGIYYPWYRNQAKPKWLSKEFGQAKKYSDVIAELKQYEYVSGGIMVIKKDILETVGGFPTDIGMNGNKIAYGEETYLQEQLREAGYKIGFNPTITMKHLVAPYKQTIRWQLQSQYALARDHVKALNSYQPIVWHKVIWRFSKLCVKSLLTAIKNAFKKEHYYWQNFVIDSLSPLYHYAGYIEGCRMFKIEN